MHLVLVDPLNVTVCSLYGSIRCPPSKNGYGKIFVDVDVYSFVTVVAMSVVLLPLLLVMVVAVVSRWRTTGERCAPVR